jgi:DNA polymerase-4
LAKEVFGRMQEEKFFGKTITVKIKYADFKIITRSKTLPHRITDFYQLWPIAREIMKGIDLSKQPVRLIGCGVGNAEEELEKRSLQLELDLS